MVRLVSQHWSLDKSVSRCVQRFGVGPDPDYQVQEVQGTRDFQTIKTSLSHPPVDVPLKLPTDPPRGEEPSHGVKRPRLSKRLTIFIGQFYFWYKYFFRDISRTRELSYYRIISGYLYPVLYFLPV